MITLEEAKELYETVSNKEISTIKALEGGMVGMVFHITTNSEEDVGFKLYEKVVITEESVDDRIYGSNHQNLISAHTLLSDKSILTFDLLDLASKFWIQSFLFTNMKQFYKDLDILRINI